MISIIIPLYNQSRELEHCLDSIKKQTFVNYEIVVVNDRSTQRLSHIMGKYKKIFGISIGFLHNATNHGAPYSRNKGFKRSRGELVIFCDADAVLRPNCLKDMHEALKNNPQSSYVYSSFIFGSKKFSSFEFDGEKLKQMPYIHSTSLIRREHFPKGGWDEELKRLQDWDLWLTMFKEGHTGLGLPQILFKIKSGGTMSSWLPKITYKILPFLPAVKKYKQAVEIIKKKHGL